MTGVKDARRLTFEGALKVLNAAMARLRRRLPRIGIALLASDYRAPDEKVQLFVR
jgi:hypothetical protein